MSQILENAFAYAQNQVRGVLEKYPATSLSHSAGRGAGGEGDSLYYPMYTVAGKFGLDRKRWTHWCDGFFPGMMFLFAEATGDEAWLENAVRYSLPLEDRQYDRAVHDLGFLFFSTYLRWRDLGGPVERIDLLLIQAGKTMAMRFMQNGQYLRSFVEPASLFIDIMMNVGTIFHAGLVTGDEYLLAIAHRHCETSRRYLVRGDGSTAHEALFDLETGECLRQSTHQGYRGDSCWSRGLAWSLYGFTRSYRQTGRSEYLQTAEANAAYLIAHIPDGGVAPWDFDAPWDGPLSRSQVDTSASAIAASGLLDLAEICPDRVRAATYRQFAISQLERLCQEYLGDRTPGFEGILNGGVYHIHKNLGVHEAVLFGDYFFVEALSKVLRRADAVVVPQVLKPYPENSLPAEYRTWQDGPTEEDLPSPETEEAQ